MIAVDYRKLPRFGQMREFLQRMEFSEGTAGLMLSNHLSRGAAARSTLLHVLELAVAPRIGVVEPAIEREIDD